MKSTMPQNLLHHHNRNSTLLTPSSLSLSLTPSINPQIPSRPEIFSTHSLSHYAKFDWDNGKEERRGWWKYGHFFILLKTRTRLLTLWTEGLSLKSKRKRMCMGSGNPNIIFEPDEVGVKACTRTKIQSNEEGTRQITSTISFLLNL